MHPHQPRLDRARPLDRLGQRMRRPPVPRRPRSAPRRETCAPACARAPAGRATPAPARSRRAVRSSARRPAPAPDRDAPQIPDTATLPAATRRGSAPKASTKSRGISGGQAPAGRETRSGSTGQLHCRPSARSPAARSTALLAHQPVAQPPAPGRLLRLERAAQLAGVIQPCSSISRPSGMRWRWRSRAAPAAVQLAAHRRRQRAPPCMRPNSSSRLQRPAPSGCARDAASPSGSRDWRRFQRAPGRTAQLAAFGSAPESPLSVLPSDPRLIALGDLICPRFLRLRRGIVCSPDACAARPPRSPAGQSCR